MKFTLLFFWALVCLTSYASEDSYDWSDSGINGPAYKIILSDMEKLQKANPKLVESINYGTTPNGRTLRMLYVRKPGAFRDRPTLLMTGSTHGNEYLNIEDRLPTEILKRAGRPGDIGDFIDQGGAFVFVPIVNPDGYETRKRGNSHNVDLNRDWDVKPAGFKGFKEVETRELAQQLEALHKEESLQYKITVDYHCCIGAVLTPWSYKKLKLPEHDFQKHATLGDLATKLLGIEWGTTGDILGYYPTGTTKDYYYSQYGATAFTYEGRFNEENKYFPKHVEWWEGMVGSLLRENRLVAAKQVKPMIASKVSGAKHVAD